jgi:hypothetical protein
VRARVNLAVLLLVALGIFFDLFIIDSNSDLRILFLTGLWILSVRWHKFGAWVSIAAGLALLTLCPLVLIFDQDPIAKKAAIWAYLFLLVGVAQKIMNLQGEV